MNKLVFAFCLAVFSITAPAAAQDSKYIVLSVHIDRVQDASNPLDAIVDCSTSSLCRALVNAMTGVDLAAVSIVAPGLQAIRDGEGSFFHLAIPSGYTYCTSSMQLTSIVPHDGPRGSMFRGVARPSEFYIETWTPRQGQFQGRSWVEGDVTVTAIRNEDAEWGYSRSGPCYHPNGERSVWYCRGGGCDGGAIDKGQNVSTDAPGANSRN